MRPRVFVRPLIFRHEPICALFKQWSFVLPREVFGTEWTMFPRDDSFHCDSLVWKAGIVHINCRTRCAPFVLYHMVRVLVLGVLSVRSFSVPVIDAPFRVAQLGEEC